VSDQRLKAKITKRCENATTALVAAATNDW